MSYFSVIDVAIMLVWSNKATEIHNPEDVHDSNSHNNNTCHVITTSWRVLGLRIEEKASRYGG
jgi:hypothetical protein